MNRDELYRLLYEREKQFESNKLKRSIKTIIAFTLIYFIIFYLAERPTGLEIIATLLVAAIVSGIHFLVNATIFGTLSMIGASEQKILDDIRKKISELE